MTRQFNANNFLFIYLTILSINKEANHVTNCDYAFFHAVDFDPLRYNDKCRIIF